MTFFTWQTKSFAGKWGSSWPKFTASVDSLTKAADAGNAKAMLRLGIMHSKGQGTAASDAKAAEWRARLAASAACCSASA